MLIVNADDWGRSRAETDAALACYEEGRITSVSAMVFMEDSQRAADLAKGTGLNVGLHLNLNQRFTGRTDSEAVARCHERVVRFMGRSKYALLVYNPALRDAFGCVYRAQAEEFVRSYGKPPAHLDGHQHRHLCANILVDNIIPAGQRVRRNFSFWPGEKSLVNRVYRGLVDRRLARRYRLTDYFFSLRHCLRAGHMDRVMELARVATVELMAHPVNAEEYGYLMSDRWLEALRGVEAVCCAAA